MRSARPRPTPSGPAFAPPGPHRASGASRRNIDRRLHQNHHPIPDSSTIHGPHHGARIPVENVIELQGHVRVGLESNACHPRRPVELRQRGRSPPASDAACCISRIAEHNHVMPVRRGKTCNAGSRVIAAHLARDVRIDSGLLLERQFSSAALADTHVCAKRPRKSKRRQL